MHYTVQYTLVRYLGHDIYRLSIQILRSSERCLEAVARHFHHPEGASGIRAKEAKFEKGSWFFTGVLHSPTQTSKLPARTGVILFSSVSLRQVAITQTSPVPLAYETRTPELRVVRFGRCRGNPATKSQVALQFDLPQTPFPRTRCGGGPVVARSRKGERGGSGRPPTPVAQLFIYFYFYGLRTLRWEKLWGWRMCMGEGMDEMDG